MKVKKLLNVNKLALYLFLMCLDDLFGCKNSF